MFELLASFALMLLPLGATVTRNASGQCAQSDRATLQVCTEYNSDTLVIHYGDHYYRGQSAPLRELAENI